VHAQLRKGRPQCQICIRCGARISGNRILNAARKTSASTLITTRLSQWCTSLLEVRQTLFSTSRLTASTKAVYSLSRFGLTEDLFFLFQMCAIMLLLRTNSRPFLTSLVPAYYTLNHSVTFIWLVVTTTHPSFLKHVRVTATAVRLNRRTCASRNSPSTLSAQSLVVQATLKEACSRHVARNLLRPLDCTRSHNNQLPQDLEERSAQGFESHIHTAHHGDSRLDHGTLTAEEPVTVLLRPMRAHSSSKDIVDREKWDLMKDSWRAHVQRASNRTRSCAMDELTRWVNEATSLLPRKVTQTGPSRRKSAHSSKIQRACDRQIRLLEQEAMIVKADPHL